jgi:hypothetical protein
MRWLLADRQGASPTVLTLHTKEVLRQLDCRLGRLRYEEELRTGPVTQLQLEEELNRVWSLDVSSRTLMEHAYRVIRGMRYGTDSTRERHND